MRSRCGREALAGAQRRLLRKERGADGKVRRHHEKQTATPCARLLAWEALEPRHRQRLESMLARHDPMEMRESIERKLRALYDLRARLEGEKELGKNQR